MEQKEAMKFFLLLIALVFTAPHLPRIEGNKYDTGDSPHWKATRFRDSLLANGRFKKDSGDDNLKTSVSNLQMIARITNAIYLQQGLISGSIPPDALISELLHFGSVKPSDISTLDTAKIQTAVDTLKALPDKLKPDADIKIVEEWFTSVEGIVKDIKGLGSIEKWNSAGVEEEIKKLKSGAFPTAVNNVKEAAVTWSGMHKNAAVNEKTAKVLLTQLITPLQTIKSALNDVSPMKPLYTFKGGSNAIDMIRPISLAHVVIENYRANMGGAVLDASKKKPYFAYLDSITTNIAPVREVEGSLVVFTRLLDSRHSQIDLQFTTGFPEGPSDLAKVHNDLKDVWIRKVINSTSFPMALDKLKELEGPLKNAHEVISSEAVVDHGASVPTAVENLNRLVSKFDELKSGITVGQGCNLPGIQGEIDYTKVKKLESHLIRIDQLLGNMTVNTNSLIQYLQDGKIGPWCDDVIKICKEAETATDINLVMTKFKAYANIRLLTERIEKIAEFAKAVVDVQDFSSQPTGTTIQKEAEDAGKLIPDLTTYHSAVKVYSKYFSCLQNEKIFVALETAELVKALRTNDPSRATSLDNGMEAIKKVAGTKDTLKKLETTIMAQKSFKSNLTDGLALLENGSTHSTTIGLAVQGVSNMKDVLERRTDLEGLLKVKDVIEKHQKTLKHPEDAKNLDSLLKLLDEIQKMLTSLDTFKKSITPSKSTTLVDYSDIFEKAKSVSGASGEFQTISATVGKLKELVTDPDEKKNLADVESTLKTMDSMGLDFVKFQKSFDGSKSSLSALDAFFTSFINQMSKVSVASAASVAAAAEMKRREKEEHDRLVYWLMVIGASVSFLVVLAVVDVILYCCYRDIFNKLHCWCRKKFNNIDYLRMIVLHFSKAIEDYAKGNKKNWTAAEYSHTYQGFGLYFDNNFEHYNSMYLVNEALCMEKNMKESLNGEPLLKKSRVKLRGYGNRFTSGFYHASYLKLMNRQSLILAQTPLYGLEGAGKDSTFAKFWWMVKQEKSKRIFMLNPLKYGDHILYKAYFPQNIGETLEFDGVTVKCVSKLNKKDKKDKKDEKDKKEIAIDEMTEVRKLTVKIGDAKEFTVEHHWLPCWETGTLQEPFLIADLVAKIVANKDKHPPIIHCGDGITETGIVALVAYAVTTLDVERKVDLPLCLKRVRESRPDCVLNKWAYAFSVLVLMEFFTAGLTIEKFPKDLVDRFMLIKDGWRDMIEVNPHEKKDRKRKKDASMKTAKSLKKTSNSTKTAVPGKDGSVNLTLKNPEEVLNKMQEEKKTLKPEQKSLRGVEKKKKNTTDSEKPNKERLGDILDYNNDNRKPWYGDSYNWGDKKHHQYMTDPQQWSDWDDKSYKPKSAETKAEEERRDAERANNRKKSKPDFQTMEGPEDEWGDPI